MIECIKCKVKLQLRKYPAHVAEKHQADYPEFLAEPIRTNFDSWEGE